MRKVHGFLASRVGILTGDLTSDCAICAGPKLPARGEEAEEPHV